MAENSKPCIADGNSSDVNLTIANMDESIALPRKNGELVFEEPWEARAFGLAVALNEEGVYPWPEFSTGLAQTISTAEEGTGQSAADSTLEMANEPSEYYQRWLASLEELILRQGLVTSAELEAEIVEQIHHDGHDHDHEHDHGHHHH